MRDSYIFKIIILMFLSAPLFAVEAKTASQVCSKSVAVGESVLNKRIANAEKAGYTVVQVEVKAGARVTEVYIIGEDHITDSSRLQNGKELIDSFDYGATENGEHIGKQMEGMAWLAKNEMKAIRNQRQNAVASKQKKSFGSLIPYTFESRPNVIDLEEGIKAPFVLKIRYGPIAKRIYQKRAETDADFFNNRGNSELRKSIQSTLELRDQQIYSNLMDFLESHSGEPVVVVMGRNHVIPLLNHLEPHISR